MTKPMKREIKFRVWDKLTKKMLTGFGLFGEVTLIGGIHTWQAEESGQYEDSLLRLGDLETMQFTGLLDKNGKEIYEGDIMTIPAGNPYDAVDGHNQVIWRLSGWFIEPVDGREYTDVDNSDLALFNYSQVSAVIGNIYSTPELLK